MRNQGQVILAIIIIAIGLMFLIGNVLQVNVWDLFCPLAFIAAGVWLLVRPRMLGAGAQAHMRLLGEIERDGAWQVADEEYWVFVGDVELDMTHAAIPQGETRLRVFGFVGDVKLTVPEGVGVAVACTGFVADVQMLGQKRSSFLTPLQASSDDYETAERKIFLETSFFVNSVKIRRS